jgi:hypothetical protein
LPEISGRKRAIGRVILVAAGDAEAQKRIIEEHTGAAVTVWVRADSAAATPAQPLYGAESAILAGPPPDVLTEALDGVSGNRVLVITGQGSAIDVILLRD